MTAGQEKAATVMARDVSSVAGQNAILGRMTARDISVLMLSLGADLDRSVGRVKEAESEAEFRRYREAVSKIMTTMLLEIMNPLYAEHPDLKPAQLR